VAVGPRVLMRLLRQDQARKTDINLSRVGDSNKMVAPLDLGLRKWFEDVWPCKEDSAIGGWSTRGSSWWGTTGFAEAAGGAWEG